MRRNVLCFVTGALVALAVVLLVRSGGGHGTGAHPSAARTTATTPVLVGGAPRSLKLHTQRRPRRHRTTAKRSARSATTATHGTRTPPAPAASGSAHPPTPTHTAPAPAPTQTTPADDGSADAAPPDGAGAQTPPTGEGTSTGSVTIPNPATPDASVGTP